MADISITITSDPTQAVNDINKVKKAADDLATTSKKVAESSAADNNSPCRCKIIRQIHRCLTAVFRCISCADNTYCKLCFKNFLVTVHIKYKRIILYLTE
jgi:hypothetical protein